MEFIPDGYNRVAEISGGRKLVFRPLVRESRVQAVGIARSLDKPTGWSFLEEIARTRIIHPREIGDLLPEDMKIIFGQDSSAAQLADVENLRAGVEFALQYPHLIDVECSQCRAWWFSPLEGRLVRDADGKPYRRTDEPLLCETGDCPLGHYSSRKGFTPKNRLAFRHWQRCKLTGVFPDDEIVRRNAGVIQEVLDGRRSRKLAGGGRAAAGSGRDDRFPGNAGGAIRGGAVTA
jgi:hypothetical protein